VQARRHDGEGTAGHQWRRLVVSSANFRVLGLLGYYPPTDNIRELHGVAIATWRQKASGWGRRWERHNVEFNMEAMWQNGVGATGH
jgi:hypothetical protein